MDNVRNNEVPGSIPGIFEKVLKMIGKTRMMDAFSFFLK